MGKYVNKKLLKAANASGKYMKLLVGESVTAKYLRCETGVDEKYKKEKHIFIFDVDGKEKELSTSAGKVIRKMAYIKPGTIVEVTKIGEGRNTDYSFEHEGSDDDDDEDDVPKKKKKVKKSGKVKTKKRKRHEIPS